MATQKILALLALAAVGAAASTIKEEGLDCEGHPDTCTSRGAQLLQATSRKSAMRAKEAGAAAAPSSSKNDPNSWYVLGISSYTIDRRTDSYAWVTVHPGGLAYKSPITMHSKSGTSDLHIYVPTSAQYMNIDVYSTWGALIGGVELPLTSNPSWCDLEKAATAKKACDYTKTLTRWSWHWWNGWQSHTIGQVSGYLVTGGNVVRKAEELHLRGRSVRYLDHSGTKTKFEQHRINASAIAQEFAYAKTGSVFPKSMHGIFWLDQRGVNLPIASDPTYKQECPLAEDELVRSFGMAEWDPTTRCSTGVTLKTSSPLKAQWSFTDTTGTGSEAHVFFSGISGTLDFCFEEGSDDSVEIWLWASLNSIINALIGISPFEWMAFVTTPRQLLSYRMVKKP